MPAEKKSHEEHVKQALRILDECGEPLQRWLKQQGLAIDQHQDYSWGSLTSPLRAQGKLAQADAWRLAQKENLVKLGVTNHSRTANEIAQRFMKAAMEKVEPTSRPMRNQVKYLSHLPVHYVWAGNHPDFVPLPDDATPDQRTKRADEITRYERKHPAPNQLAINMLLSCQQDKSARQNLFKETNNFTRDERKKVKTVKTEQEKEEDRACDDIEAEIEKLSKKVRVN